MTKADFEDVLKLIIDGLTFREIAKQYDVAVSTLHEYLNKTEHSARVRDALAISAASYADKAEDVLKAIDPDSTVVEMSRARELASHWRWMAAKRNPRGFGDRVEQVITGAKSLPEWMSEGDK